MKSPGQHPGLETSERRRDSFALSPSLSIPTTAAVNSLYEHRVRDYFTSLDACSCPDFRYRRRARPCKHVAALRDAYKLIKAVLRKWETAPPT